jgi:outer membrane protein assembly factor BamB
MTHNLHPLCARAALCLLALSVPLRIPVAARQAAAPKKNETRKKTGTQKKSQAAGMPGGQDRQQGRHSEAGSQKQQAAQGGQQAQQLMPSLLIRWQGRPGVNRYRLQVARDERFEDIVFDGAVEGRQYVVRELPAGNYFWRVAAAAAETSAAYTRPERVSVRDSNAKVEVANVLMPADAGGWRTATGEVVGVVSAQLRSGPVVDFVGVGADGRVSAVDGASGISLWTARFNPVAPRGAVAVQRSENFTPLVVQARPNETSVVVATDGGVRALRGETGREMWRAKLEGRAASGVVTDLDADGNPEVVVLTSDPEKLYVLDGGTGRVLANQKVDGEASGAPYPLVSGGTRGVVLGLTKGRVEIRGADGAVVKDLKLEGRITTPPLIVKRGEMPILVIGTDAGMWAMSIPDLKLLGAIKADDDSLRGTLSTADLDGDGATEIVMVTKRGRVALVSTTDGNVRWYAEGATDAASATFADVNADGVLDVIVPGGNAFALGFSGRDGSLVMKIEEGGRAGEKKADGALRSLVVAPTVGGGAMLVGSDPERVGLRAVELPKGSIRAASNF